MAGSLNNIDGDDTLKEWAPLADLFTKLPIKSQSGIFAQDVKLTCLDVLPEFITLGTNVGVAYWYDRRKKDLQRLRCEKQNIQVSVVKVTSTVDYMVACGNQDGSLNIFQIPKSHPNSLPENLKPKNNKVERYIVSQLHKSTVTALEWSKNGMKLFSGDKNGCIVLTEFDFDMHICKSVEILNETYEVVQLSYHQPRLLVSTTYRSIICHNQGKWKVCQIGKKDRKILGQFGGIILQSGPKVSDILLYCTRPGLRIWVSDCEGNVLKTLLFKELLCKNSPEVQIINPISKNLRMLKPHKEPSFGILLPFNGNLILTYNNDVIYILHPETMTVIATMKNFRSVLWVATSKDEIFVLEEDRSIVRISYRPEPVYDVDISQFASTGSGFLPLTTSIKDLTHKIQSTNIIPAISPFNNHTPVNDLSIHTDNLMIMNAEEAKESPKKKMDNGLRHEKTFSDIGKQQFSDTILFKHKHKKKKSVMGNSTVSLSSNSSEEKDLTSVRPTLMTLSSVGILPDLRSPESIQSDIEYKERILADVLSLDKIRIPLNDVKEVFDNDDNSGHLPDIARDFILNSKRQEIVQPSISSNDRVTPKTKIEPLGSSKTNHGSTKEPVLLRPPQNSTPALRNIPNDWKLPEIQVEVKGDTSDNSLADWEIL